MLGPGGMSGPNVGVGGSSVDVGVVVDTGVKLGCLPGAAGWRSPEVVDWKNPEPLERVGALRIPRVETDCGSLKLEGTGLLGPSVGVGDGVGVGTGAGTGVGGLMSVGELEFHK